MCAARALKAQWSSGPGLPVQATLVDTLRAGPVHQRRDAGEQGRAPARRVRTARRRSRRPISGRCRATPRSARPARSPTCAPTSATVWTASQGTHGNRNTFARFLGLPREKVRLIYLEGSGCYGMNGHEDAAADAAILSRAVGRPVRVQWSREDEHGWDPEGPAAAARRFRRGRRRRPHSRLAHRDVDSADHARTARTFRCWRRTPPASSRRRASMPASSRRTAIRPMRRERIQVIAHWLKDAPLRPAPIRSPGKPANCFAVESFIDELAAAARHRSGRVPAARAAAIRAASRSSSAPRR